MLGTFDLTVFILSQWSQHLTVLLVFFCDDKYICCFLLSNQVVKGLTLKVV